MKSNFRTVALIGKYMTPGDIISTVYTGENIQEVANFLLDLGFKVAIEEETSRNLNIRHPLVLSLNQIGEQCDLALVLGGDGTMLGISRQLAPYKVPLIGINQGRLGFITDIPFKDFKSALTPILAGDFDEDRRQLIQAKVIRKEVCIFQALAMNDVVVNRGTTAGMVELRVEVEGRFVANQRADGLIIASPTGSTAYALSSGGPLLHPNTDGWVMVPIAPHTLSNRPIVLSNSVEISIELVAGRDASANFDMQSLADLQIGDKVVVSHSPHYVRFLHHKGWSYFDTLREKLHWNEGVA